MKKIKMLGMVAILSLLCIGCGKSVEEKIAGDWKLIGKDGEKVEYDYELKFWDDGKFMIMQEFITFQKTVFD